MECWRNSISLLQKIKACSWDQILFQKLLGSAFDFFEKSLHLGTDRVCGQLRCCAGPFPARQCIFSEFCPVSSRAGSFYIALRCAQTYGARKSLFFFCTQHLRTGWAQTPRPCRLDVLGYSLPPLPGLILFRFRHSGADFHRLMDRRFIGTLKAHSSTMISDTATLQILGAPIPLISSRNGAFEYSSQFPVPET